MVTEREKARLGQELYATASQFSSAFQNEVGVLSAIFSMVHEDIEDRLANGEWKDFQERWELWRSYAFNPYIITDFHIFRYEQTISPTLWMWNNQSFTRFEDPQLASIFNAAAMDRLNSRNFMDPVGLYGTHEAFVLPLDTQQQYWLAITIDTLVFNGILIPYLAERFLLGKDNYYYRVVDQHTEKVIYRSETNLDDHLFERLDLVYPLVRSDFHFELPTPQAGDATLLPPKGRSALNILKTRREILEAQIDPKLREATAPPLPPLSFSIDTNARWVLQAVHRSGSLTSAVRSGTILTMSLSSGILSLLGIALIVLAIAVRRTQNLANRQQEFIASVTHELKTPIAVIRSAADNLADGMVTSPERMPLYGRTIQKESYRLGDMIDRLLIYARIGDRKTASHETVDIVAVLTRILTHYQENLEKLAFRTEFHMPESCITRGDEAALEIVFGNLVANALKHAASGRFLGIQVRIIQTDRHEAVSITVRDKGPGIPRRERRLIFDAFYRGEKARQEQHSGSGLGLNLSRRIISAHGGTIKMEPFGDMGSSFIITLPMESRHE
jgi:signal transduction histidine kinase